MFLSLFGVAVVVSSISAAVFFFRLFAAQPALGLLVLFEAALAFFFFSGATGLAVLPAGLELLELGSAVETLLTLAPRPRPRPPPRFTKAAKIVASEVTAALCRVSTPVSEQSNLATNQGT